MPHDDRDRQENQEKGLRLLFADDETSLQELMRLELPRMGHRVTVCPDGTTAAAALEENTFDCLLVDLDMPGLSGIEVIARARRLSPETDAIVLTGKGTLETAIEALRHGAFDYLTKPCRLIELETVLKRVIDRRKLQKKYLALKRRLERIEGASDLIGRSRAMEEVRKRIAKVAPTSSTVLILGETGTGKELVARALHDQSLRYEKPFVAVNCGALPEHLIESELFGHRKGAFTGADEHRVGLFEVADGGTLFLDEIGELPAAAQAKLLRFLESGEIRRLGENEAFECDVRVLCATHRQLEDMVADERFRQDLWFRINTFEIVLPSLRERREDIPELAAHLARRQGPVPLAPGNLFTPDMLEVLNCYDWPGNVRELANVVEHAMILCDELPLTPDALPPRIVSNRRDGGNQGPSTRQPIGLRVAAEDDRPRTLREIEMEAIHEALDRNEGNKPKAAEQLGISLKTLYNRLNQESSSKNVA